MIIADNSICARWHPVKMMVEYQERKEVIINTNIKM